MEIRNIRHKGLRNYIEKGERKGLPAERIRRIGQIVGFLLDMTGIDEFYDLQKWQPHVLSGDRDGTYSLTVTANYRITFMYDEAEDEIFDLDYEDYH